MGDPLEESSPAKNKSNVRTRDIHNPRENWAPGKEGLCFNGRLGKPETPTTWLRLSESHIEG